MRTAVVLDRIKDEARTCKGVHKVSRGAKQTGTLPFYSSHQDHIFNQEGRNLFYYMPTTHGSVINNSIITLSPKLPAL